MCLILFSYKLYFGYKLILVANRDEHYNRATNGLGFWEDKPIILAGRDLVSGGTWLGVTKTGRFAAITSFRNPSLKILNARSRGLIVSDFLDGVQDPVSYIKQLMGEKNKYKGFSLILGDHANLYYYSNQENTFKILNPGLYGLSNNSLDTEWPKVKKGKAWLKQLLSGDSLPPFEDFFCLLADQTQPSDAELPRISSDIKWERTLSSIFVKSPSYNYGTCSSALLFYHENGKGIFVERSFISGKSEDKKTEFSTKYVY